MARLAISGKMVGVATKEVLVPVSLETVNKIRASCVTSSQRLTLAVLIELGLRYVDQQPGELVVFDAETEFKRP